MMSLFLGDFDPEEDKLLKKQVSLDLNQLFS